MERSFVRARTCVAGCAIHRRAVCRARLADAAEKGRLMRALIVVHGFPPQAQGGSEVYAHAHARTLRRQYGDDVLVLTRENDPAKPEYDVHKEELDGLKVI